MAGGGFLIASMVMLIPSRTTDAVLVIGSLALASFLCDFVIPVSWGACIDVGGRYAGTYSGSMNMMGNLGGAVSPFVIGSMLKKSGGDFSQAFYMSSGVFFIGALCWLLIDPVK